MVRGVRSGASSQRSTLLAWLAELSALGFFNQCFKKMVKGPPKSESDSIELMLAASVLGLLTDKAQGWQFVPYINGDVIARYDGKTPDTNPLYIRKHQGVLPPNDETEAALARVPESFTLGGKWFSFARKMQTKGLVMQKETFLKLFKREISVAEVYEQAKIVDVEPLKYTDQFSRRCDDPLEAALKHWKEDNKFTESDHYKFVEGHWSNPTFKMDRNLGLMYCHLDTELVAHRLLNMQACPTLAPECHWHDGKSVVVTYISNDEDQTGNWRRRIPFLAEDGIGITAEWALYFDRAGKKKGCSGVPSLWQMVRPLFAIANHLAVDYALSEAGLANPNVAFYKYCSCPARAANSDSPSKQVAS